MIDRSITLRDHFGTFLSVTMAGGRSFLRARRHDPEFDALIELVRGCVELGLDGQSRRYHPNPILEHAALCWLEGDDSPRLMVDRDLRLVWANPAADAVLANRQGLTLRQGMVATTDSARQDALRASVLGAIGKPASLCLTRPDGEGWLLVDAVRAAQPPAEVFALALVIVHERERAHYRHLDVAFGLTTAEHRVLLGLLDGNEAEALAVQQGVTIDTTRSQIRGIYAKLAVKSREQLFAKVQGFRSSQ